MTDGAALDEYPDCQECETDLFVTRAKSNDSDWRCHNCGRRW